MEQTRLPVLLVPGLDDTSVKMRMIRKVLQEKGFLSVHSMNISPSDGSIPFEEMGLQVAEEVEALKVASGSARVDIVAYSMGTLAVRHYLHLLGGSSRVRRFISLAGPHHGTLTAFFRWNVGVRQMQFGSQFLRKMKEMEGAWGDMQVFSLWTPFDLMIIPATSSRLKGADNRMLLLPVHPSLVLGKKAVREVVRILEE